MKTIESAISKLHIFLILAAMLSIASFPSYSAYIVSEEINDPSHSFTTGRGIDGKYDVPSNEFWHFYLANNGFICMTEEDFGIDDECCVGYKAGVLDRNGALSDISGYCGSCGDPMGDCPQDMLWMSFGGRWGFGVDVLIDPNGLMVLCDQFGYFVTSDNVNWYCDGRDWTPNVCGYDWDPCVEDSNCCSSLYCSNEHCCPTNQVWTNGACRRLECSTEGRAPAQYPDPSKCPNGCDPSAPNICSDGLCHAVCPTCSDGTQNQGETGVDCGGPCPPCSYCGNAQIDSGEQCDGTNLNGQTCISKGFTGGTLSCRNCQFDTSGCTTTSNPFCGNGIINSGEQCDGTNFGSATCATEGFSGGGSLYCYPPGQQYQCLIDTFNCISGGVCTPGSTQSCGFCGTRTCQSNSQWGTCQNQGICNPGTSQSCSGGTQTCQSNCQWGSCQGTCGDVQVSCGGTCTNNCASTLCDSNPCNGCTNQCVTCGGNPPDNYGQACNCNPNCPSNCGGTIQCDRSCSGPTPSCGGVPTSANGYVFRDANKNGQFDSQDEKLSSQTVLIRDVADQNTITSTITNSNGDYSITFNLEANNARIKYNLPPGYIATTDNSVTIDRGQTKTWNFGIFGSSSCIPNGDPCKGNPSSCCSGYCPSVSGSPDVCAPQGVCNPNTWSNTGSNCGNCGTEQRYCGSNGQWTSQYQCISQGPCAPGQTKCSGSSYQSCSSGCQWQAAGTDNDGDGVAFQCGDSQCDNAYGVYDSTKTSTETKCADSLDNDCDGKRDCQDTDCAGQNGPGGSRCCQTASNCVQDDCVIESCVSNTCQYANRNSCDSTECASGNYCYNQDCTDADSSEYVCMNCAPDTTTGIWDWASKVFQDAGKAYSKNDNAFTRLFDSTESSCGGSTCTKQSSCSCYGSTSTQNTVKRKRALTTGNCCGDDINEWYKKDYYGGECVSSADQCVWSDGSAQQADSGNKQWWCNPGNWYECNDDSIGQSNPPQGVCCAGIVGSNGWTPQSEVLGENQYSCSDGKDNDCDGKTDCEDTDCYGTITGTVTSNTGSFIAQADITAKKALASFKSALTSQDGTYSLPIDCGTYNLVASHPNYGPETKGNVVVPPTGEVIADFILTIGSSCEEDCTYIADDIVHASCDNKNGCSFYDDRAKEICDFSQVGWIRDYNETHYIVCGEGMPRPKTEAEASVSCSSGTLVKVTRIVFYNGKPVKLVVAACG